MLKRFILTNFLVLVIGIPSKAQSNNAPSDFNPHDLKITGYFQFQYQKAQTQGQHSMNGGDFLDHVDERFMVRRGRFKFDRVDQYTNIVFQLDATQDGVSLRDGFIQLRDPKWNIFTLTAGQFTKPFGYILSYSSANREFPERPRTHQLLMPSERDLGAMLGIRIPKLPFLNFEIGYFNGSGMNAKDYDSKKDLSSTLQFNFNELKKNWNLGVGFSYYHGFVRHGTSTTYRNVTNGNLKGFEAVSGVNIVGSFAKRTYYGINLQTDFSWAIGKTTLKTELIAGTQPGVAASPAISPGQANRSFGVQPVADIYNRNFSGIFVWLVQEIPNTQLQWIGSFDSYDPNTYVSGVQIGQAGSNTGAGDIRFNTIGTGFVYYFNKQVKLTAYYDHPINESTTLSTHTKDLRDDVFTLRAQYRF
ncbi:MAG: hypothetical protein RI924_325 [Bacteroidota bacterium]